MGFPLPTAHSGGKGPLNTGHAKARYAPPSGFGYPRDGFLPLSPRRACFVPTALLGLIPSKRSPPARWRKRFRNPRTCLPLAATRSPAGRTERTGASCTDFQALTPAEVPGCPRAVSPRLAGCSPGIPPFQGVRRLPCPRFRTDLPSRALRARSEDRTPPAPQGFDRQPTGPTRRLNSEPLETRPGQPS
jgi:hypothetical protein